MFESSFDQENRVNLKRNANGESMCLCIKNCIKNICSCQKKNKSCSKYCKCSISVCANRHSPVSFMIFILKIFILPFNICNNYLPVAF